VKSDAHTIAKQFTSAAIKEVSALGNGLINDTFLVKTEQKKFILQRINTQVFLHPGLIMENLDTLHQHLKAIPAKAVKLNIPNYIATHNKQAYYLDKEANFWRALEYIEDSTSKEHLSNQSQAEQIGFALGHFHRLFHKADVTLFNDTLPGFHITPDYFKHYLSIEHLETSSTPLEETQQCRQFIKAFTSKINSLENAKQQGLLTERMTHGDPKLNNFLFAKNTHKIISLIDLDTVKPGLIHYDIADCIRSCCHNSSSNTLDLALAKTILNSYLNETVDFFTDYDYAFLYTAIELIPFELGLRFFADYLEGNKYFKVDSATQNLDRALAQFQLCEDIAKQEKNIRQFIYSKQSLLV